MARVTNRRLVIVLFALLVLAAPAQAAAPVTLKIIFPEGFTVRKMVSSCPSFTSRLPPIFT